MAYVKFDKASNAADAMENLNGVVLNNGRGPKLKVLLAESPNSRYLAFCESFKRTCVQLRHVFGAETSLHQDNKLKWSSHAIQITSRLGLDSS